MMKISLTVEHWVALQQQLPDGAGQIPVAELRAATRKLIVAVAEEELKVGDIVLFPGKHEGGDYCLHRLYRIEGNRVQTFGDGNRHPDYWQPKSQILGKVVLFKRGRLTIDCDSPLWVRLFHLWNKLLLLRPILLLPFQVMNKLHRQFPKFF